MAVQAQAWREEGHNCSGAGIEKRAMTVQREHGDEGQDCSDAGMGRRGT